MNISPEEETARAAGLGYMVGLDGRHIEIKSEHYALSVYLQGGEAVIMKKALILAYNKLKRLGIDWKLVGFIHDEWQSEVSKEEAEETGRVLVQAIKEAGEHFNLNIPLDGEFKVGLNWKETH